MPQYLDSMVSIYFSIYKHWKCFIFASEYFKNASLSYEGVIVWRFPSSSMFSIWSSIYRLPNNVKNESSSFAMLKSFHIQSSLSSLMCALALAIWAVAFFTISGRWWRVSTTRCRRRCRSSFPARKICWINVVFYICRYVAISQTSAICLVLLQFLIEVV